MSAFINFFRNLFGLSSKANQVYKTPDFNPYASHPEAPSETTTQSTQEEPENPAPENNGMLSTIIFHIVLDNDNVGTISVEEDESLTGSVNARPNPALAKMSGNPDMDWRKPFGDVPTGLYGFVGLQSLNKEQGEAISLHAISGDCAVAEGFNRSILMILPGSLDDLYANGNLKIDPELLGAYVNLIGRNPNATIIVKIENSQKDISEEDFENQTQQSYPRYITSGTSRPYYRNYNHTTRYYDDYDYGSSYNNDDMSDLFTLWMLYELYSDYSGPQYSQEDFQNRYESYQNDPDFVPNDDTPLGNEGDTATPEDPFGGSGANIDSFMDPDFQQSDINDQSNTDDGQINADSTNTPSADGPDDTDNNPFGGSGIDVDDADNATFETPDTDDGNNAFDSGNQSDWSDSDNSAYGR